MSLNDLIRRGATRGPQRIVLHGPEGVGKTTFAAGAPSPVFVGTEDGFGDLDVARLPAPQDWPGLLDYIAMLTNDPHDFRTVVIDTLDHLERLVWEHVRTEYKKPTIEEVGGGFGKGYTYAAEEFGRLASALDRLRERRRMHVVALAHSHIKTFKNPDGTDYDRYELRMQKLAAALWKEWPDVLLFATWDVKVATAEWRQDKALLAKGKAADDGRRRLYTTRAASHDAKNRYSLPEELDLSWGAFARAMKFDEIEGRLRAGGTNGARTNPPASAEDQDAAFRSHMAKIGAPLDGDTGLDAWRASKGEEPALKLDREGRTALYKALKAEGSELLASYREWAAERASVAAESTGAAAEAK
jgi:hypothetical protein